MTMTREEIVTQSAEKTAEKAIKRYVDKIGDERSRKKRIYQTELAKVKYIHTELDKLSSIYDKFYSFEYMKKREPYYIDFTENDVQYSLDTTYISGSVVSESLNHEWNDSYDKRRELERDILKKADEILSKKIGKVSSNVYKRLTLYATKLDVTMLFVDPLTDNPSSMSVHSVYLTWDNNNKKIEFECYYASHNYRRYKNIKKLLNNHRDNCIINCKQKYIEKKRNKQLEIGKAYFKRNNIAGFETKEGYGDQITFQSKSGNFRAMTHYTKNRQFDPKNPIPGSVNIGIDNCTYDQMKRILSAINEIL